MSENNLPKDKAILQSNEEDSSSQNGTENSNSSLLENYFGPNGIFPLDTSNQSTAATPSSENSSTNPVDKRFLLQNEDIEEDFNELSMNREQDQESLDNSFFQLIQDLGENLEENDNASDVQEEEKKSIVLLGRKRTKSHDLEPYSSDEE